MDYIRIYFLANIRQYGIRNEYIRHKVEVAPIENKDDRISLLGGSSMHGEDLKKLQ